MWLLLQAILFEPHRTPTEATNIKTIFLPASRIQNFPLPFVQAISNYGKPKYTIRLVNELFRICRLRHNWILRQWLCCTQILGSSSMDPPNANFPSSPLRHWRSLFPKSLHKAKTSNRIINIILQYVKEAVVEQGFHDCEQHMSILQSLASRGIEDSLVRLEKLDV